MRKESDQLQNRLDKVYEDKLDGEIDAAFFDRKAADWNAEQGRVQRRIAEHQEAKKEGIMLLELAAQAHLVVERQPLKFKRQFLELLLSNCSWKGGELKVQYSEPFDILVKMNEEQAKKKATEGELDGLSPVERGGVDGTRKR